MHQTLPQALLPVLPAVGAELKAEGDGQRLDAADLLCRLFAAPAGGGEMMASYQGLVMEVLGRLTDIKVRAAPRGAQESGPQGLPAQRFSASGTICCPGVHLLAC